MVAWLCYSPIFFSSSGWFHFTNVPYGASCWSTAACTNNFQECSAHSLRRPTRSNVQGESKKQGSWGLSSYYRLPCHTPLTIRRLGSLHERSSDHNSHRSNSDTCALSGRRGLSLADKSAPRPLIGWELARVTGRSRTELLSRHLHAKPTVIVSMLGRKAWAGNLARSPSRSCTGGSWSQVSLAASETITGHAHQPNTQCSIAFTKFFLRGK